MNKTWWIVLIVIVVGAWWMYSNKTNLPGYGDLNPVNYSPSPTPGKSLKASPKTSEPESVSADYNTLLKQYVGRYIQFDSLCHGIPGQMVVKKGQSILLDNRSADTKTIKLDSQSYMLPGYNYRIVLIGTTKPLPYSLGIDCKSVNGSTENTAVINVQALIYQ